MFAPELIAAPRDIAFDTNVTLLPAVIAPVLEICSPVASTVPVTLTAPPNAIVAFVPVVVPVIDRLRIVLLTAARVTLPAASAPPVEVLIVRFVLAAEALTAPPLNVTLPAAVLLPVSVSIVIELAVTTVFPAKVSEPPSS